MSSETKTKKCIVCNIEKDISLFVIKRNTCKSCRNEKTRNHYANLIVNDNELNCNTCKITKPIDEFYKRRKICIACDNIKRRDRYNNNEERRKRASAASIKCRKGKPISEYTKITRNVRSSLFRYIDSKSQRTHEYLGCSIPEYIKWLSNNDKNYTMDNRGTEWHVDHVIPLSHFDIVNDKNIANVAFNWRNTMALSVKDNLKKSNKIIPEQIEEHLQRLIIYHEENNIELPQTYIDLFAKHLDAGISPRAYPV